MRPENQNARVFMENLKQTLQKAFKKLKQPKMDPTPRIVLFGDSLTEWGFDEKNQGFGWQLQQYYGKKVQVLNRGQAAYSSTMLQPHFKSLMKDLTAPGAPATLMFTIFLGANDACLPMFSAHVPLPRYEANLREFVESIITNDRLSDTKVVLITPPPVNIRDRLQEALDFGPDASKKDPKKELEEEKLGKEYQTYANKKLYAEKVMEIAKDVESTGANVIGLNFWKTMVDAALKDQGRLGDEDQYDENRLPGCGLPDAKEFDEGYFIDGLHFGKKGYELLGKELMGTVFTRWPELRKENFD